MLNHHDLEDLGTKVTDNNGNEYTIEAAAKHLIDERRGVEATFNSATQEQKEDIRQEMVYIINEGW